ncbi:MAG: zf-HC2 domain-containing protein [Vicinamibacteria bacterium]|nr:zf-HC2 domain-containing protein [Vicinamibacteria bacterium]
MDCSEFHEPMIDVLYGEADADTSRKVEQHLSECSACREELAALHAVKRHLAAWKTPRFSRRPFRRPFEIPASLWRLAAAAALLLATGGALGLSGIEVAYDKGPWTVRLGRSEPVANIGSPSAPAPSAKSASFDSGTIEELRAALRAETALQEDALLNRFEQMIRDSETRQMRARGVHLADLKSAIDRQRRYDMARVTAGLSYLDGKTGADMARTTELMGYMLQASQRREP